MASRRRPEQRATAAERRPGQPSAQPTGQEVFSTRSEMAEDDHRSGRTSAEQVEMEGLERAVDESHEQLGELAERLTDRAADAYRSGGSYVRDHPRGTLVGSFAVGVLVAVLMSRR